MLTQPWRMQKGITGKDEEDNSGKNSIVNVIEMRENMVSGQKAIC